MILSELNGSDEFLRHMSFSLVTYHKNRSQNDLTPGQRNNLNNYLTRVRLSVCLSVAMVPTLRHLRLRAAQTVASSRVKFAQFVVNELRHLHVEKRGRWGA